jgi:hypothetical protein
VVIVLPHAHRHDDLFERGVAGPLADAVDRAFDLARAVFDRGQAVGDRQAQVVVAALIVALSMLARTLSI